MEVLILGGFLGSGKTTLMLSLIEAIRNRAKQTDSLAPTIAILENEIGSVGIDDKIAEDRGYSVTSMLSGCACCSAAADLPYAVMGIQRDMDPDLLIVEGSGIALPGAIRDGLSNALGLRSKVCVLVDASRWFRIREPLENLLSSQLEAASLICLNKIDLVDATDLETIEESIREFNAEAPLIRLSATNDDETARLVEYLDVT